MKFSDQAPKFLEQLAARKRRPVKPATMRAYQGYVRNWILPRIGYRDLEDFNNGAMKRFAEGLTELGPKSLHEVVGVVKQIISSVVSEDGDYVYPRQWNNDFLDLPEIRRQHQPMLTLEQLKAVLSLPEPFRTFGAMLAGSGLRIGEALALRFGQTKDKTAWLPDDGVILVRSALWQGQEQEPKTQAAVRDVDLHPHINRMLCNLMEQRLSDTKHCFYCGVELIPWPVVPDLSVFWSLPENRGKPYATTDHRIPKSKGGTDDPSNIVTACVRCNSKKNDSRPEEFQPRIFPFWESQMRSKLLKPLGISGFHSFRRFRISWLRSRGVPEDIIRFWSGHAGPGITDRYSKQAEFIAQRRKWAFDAGLGFNFPHATGHEAPEDGENIPVWVSGFKE